VVEVVLFLMVQSPERERGTEEEQPRERGREKNSDFR